jgi:hypothetical protein
MSTTEVDSKLTADLISIYEEIMWLSMRPNVTGGRARAWYTHIMAESTKKRIRRFSGQVSRVASSEIETDLRLEHFKRIQTTLTGLVERHRSRGIRDPEEFVSTVLDYEQVHIVTFEENYAAMRAKGDYEEAGIELVPWVEVPKNRQQELWQKMLRGKVANAAEFKP